MYKSVFLVLIYLKYFKSAGGGILYLYKMVDISDDIVKYIGIVYKDGKSVKQRIIEHLHYDDWCKERKWRVYWIELNSRTDCEFLESHFISYYKTYNYFNTGKCTWGETSLPIDTYFTWNREPVVFSREMFRRRYNAEKSFYKNIFCTDNYIDYLYNKNIVFFNNGYSYALFESLDKRPVYVLYGNFSYDDAESLFVKYGRKYKIMSNRQVSYLINRVDHSNDKYFGYAEFFSEDEQLSIQPELSYNKLYTVKLYNRLFKSTKEYLEKIRFMDEKAQSFVEGLFKDDFSKLKIVVRDSVYSMDIGLESETSVV